MTSVYLQGWSFPRHPGQPVQVLYHSCSERFPFHVIGISLTATCDLCLLPFQFTPLHHFHNPSLGSAVKYPCSVFSILNPCSFTTCLQIMCSSLIMVWKPPLNLSWYVNTSFVPRDPNGCNGTVLPQSY